MQDLNPLLFTVPYMPRLAKIFISISEGNYKKIFYESGNYESVDEKAYLWLCPEKIKKKNSGFKGLSAGVSVGVEEKDL